jgi:hypothetical protein
MAQTTRQVAERRAGGRKPDPAIDTARAAADALHRTAAEWIRQRERCARLVEMGAPDDEQRAADTMIEVCAKLLKTRMDAYERASAAVAAESPGNGAADWRKDSNALWRATREYRRRQETCDDAHRALRDPSPAKLNELTLESDLAASALLGLQQAIERYQPGRRAADDAAQQITAAGGRSRRR